MKEESKQDKNNKINNNALISITLIIMVMAILACVIGMFCPRYSCQSTDNIVITFVGILATFVVVSNYAQVIEIRNDLNKKVDKIIKEMDDTQEKMKKIENIINDLDDHVIIKHVLVKIKTIGLKLSKEKDQGKREGLLERLRIYAGFKNINVRSEIYSIVYDNIFIIKSYREFFYIDSVIEELSPMGDKHNDLLPSINELGYCFLKFNLYKNLYAAWLGFSIMKRVGLIKNDEKDEAIGYLSTLSKTLKKKEEKIITSFLDTLIKDLDNSDLSIPIFEKEVNDKFNEDENKYSNV